MFLKEVLIVVILFIAESRSQEYDFGAEITRQCLVPDPVGLLDCVENKVTLPYLKSWVDCTNSLGENVKTSADIINYRCKSVWEGKGVIPEVFYIKDCVIEKTGLPPKNVSAEVLGAYKECEKSPAQPARQSSSIKSAPIQQQQLAVPPPQQPTSSIKTATPPQQQISQPAPLTYAVPSQQQIKSAEPSYGQPQLLNAPQTPLQRQPFSQQYFVIYPRASAPIQPQTLGYQAASPVISQQQIPISNSAFSPQPQPPAPIQQQQITYGTTISQQPLQSFVSQQQVSTGVYAQPNVNQMYQPYPNFPAYGAIPNGAYYYGFEIHHPQRLN